jgi:MFS family permease
MLAATPQSDYNSIPNHEDSVNDFNRLQQPKRNCYSIIHDLLGFEVLRSLHPDAVLLMWGKVLRLFSFGFLAVILVVYLAELGFPATDIGLLQTWTLLGDAIISIVMTSHADKIGRRTMLIAGALLSIVTSIVFATQRNFWVLLVSAIIGVISPSGNEIGPFMAIELSGLSQVSRDSDRTRLLAWYNLFGCFASAIGGLFCGVLITHLTESVGVTVLNAYRIVMMVYAAIQVLLCMLFANLGGDIEVPRDQARVREANPVSLFLGLHKSKMIVLRLSLLFMVDAFAGAFVLQSLISNWFLVR